MGKNAKKLLNMATWKLVLEKGFKATKVQDICKEAGVSKMTFYYYYENKQDIIAEVLQMFFDHAIHSTKSIIKKDLPFHEKIMELVEWKAEFVKSMSREFLNELYNGGGQYMNMMKDVMQETQTLMYNFYADGKSKGEINRTVDIQVIMFWMNIVSDMMIEGKFNHLFADPNEMYRQTRDLILYGVLGNREEGDYHDLTMF